MHDVDRPTHVQTLSQPAWSRGPRVKAKPFRLVLRPQDIHRIARNLGRRRDLGQKLAVGAAELELAIRLPIDLVTLLVDSAVMAATLCRLRFYAAFGVGLGGARAFVRGIIRAPQGRREAGQPADSASAPRAAVPCARSRAP